VSPILGIWASAQQAAFGVGDYESIATVLVGSGGTASVTFSSIPATYQHLQIRILGKSGYTGGTGPDNFHLRLNGDSTTTNYYRHSVRGNGSSVDVAPGNDNLFVSSISTSGDNADTYGAVVADILDYANANKNTVTRYLGGVDYNGVNGYIQLGSILWNNTAAVTTVYVAPGNAWAQDTHVALYGIKG
jgi:hypothetical protein